MKQSNVNGEVKSNAGTSFRWRDIPWGLRLGLNFALCALLLFSGYLLEGMPGFTPEMAFRRAERQQLLPKGELVGSYDTKRWQTDTRLLAASYGEEAAALFRVQRDSALGLGWGSYGEGDFYFVNKSPGVTVMACPDYRGYMTGHNDVLYLAAFHHCENAVRATLELTVSGDFTIFGSSLLVGDGNFHLEYTLESVYGNAGVFFFELSPKGEPPESGINAEHAALHALSLTAEPYSGAWGPTFPAKLTLFGNGGEVLTKLETTVARAYAK